MARRGRPGAPTAGVVTGRPPALDSAGVLAQIAADARASLRAAGALGASATRSSLRLDRHWRNLRTLFSHNPTVFTAPAIGDVVGYF